MYRRLLYHLLGAYLHVNLYQLEFKYYYLHAGKTMFLAVKHNQKEIVEFLLQELNSDPNITDENGKTLIDLSRENPDITRLLLQHGAKDEEVYKKHSKLIGKISSERPPDLPLYTLIVGDSDVGKSTLMKSLYTSKRFLAKLRREAKPVEGVDEKTVGIISYEVYTKEFGKIIVFDFAGQKEFYPSHCAILENAVQTSPPIVFLCANLVEGEEKISNSAYRWLTLIQNQCSNLREKAHVIVIGSHADVVKQNGEDPWAKGGIFADIIQHFPQFEYVEFIPMDCRFPDSDDMKKAKQLFQKSSAILRSPEVINLNAHTFYIYLFENFKGHLVVSLGDVNEKVRSDLNDVQEKRMKDILSFIPTTLTRLLEICDQLHKSGLLLFLRNDSCIKKSILVIDKETLLSKVTGTMFAPQNFHQHCKLASSTGIVPLSNFEKAFSGYNIDMLISFMHHLELCFEITDKQVLVSICRIVNLVDIRFLFFPALITIDSANCVCVKAPSVSYNFTWFVKCPKGRYFFDPRSLQVLILRLVLTFNLAPAKDIELVNPAHQNLCSVWKSGICWCNDDGVTAHIELVDNKSYAVKICSLNITPQSLAHWPKIISKVFETVVEFSPNISVVKSVIDPQDIVSHSLKSTSELTLFGIKDDANAITSKKDPTNSVHRPLAFQNLLQFEPYACRDINTLQSVHSDKSEETNKQLFTGKIFICQIPIYIYFLCMYIYNIVL